MKWGPYFREDAEEQAKVVGMATAAKDAGLVTLTKAVERIAPIFGIENVPAFVEALEEEALANQEKAVQNAEAMARVAGKKDSDEETPGPNDRGQQPGQRSDGSGR